MEISFSAKESFETAILNSELQELARSLRQESERPDCTYRYAIGVLYPRLWNGEATTVSPDSYDSSRPTARLYDNALRLRPEMIREERFKQLPVLNRHSPHQRMGEVISTRIVGEKLYGVLRLDRSNKTAMEYYDQINHRIVGLSIRYVPKIVDGKMVDADIQEVSLTHSPQYRGADLTIAASKDPIVGDGTRINCSPYF